MPIRKGPFMWRPCTRCGKSFPRAGKAAERLCIDCHCAATGKSTKVRSERLRRALKGYSGRGRRRSLDGRKK